MFKEEGGVASLEEKMGGRGGGGGGRACYVSGVTIWQAPSTRGPSALRLPAAGLFDHGKQRLQEDKGEGEGGEGGGHNVFIYICLIERTCMLWGSTIRA